MVRGTDDMPGSEGPIFEIADATLAGMHLIIQLFGPSQCGKTLTALYLARGIADALAGPEGIVGCMDTEGRARMYAAKIPGGFKVGELTRPFMPSRYLEGIHLFMEYGVNVLVIDSFSHVWEGVGGVLDQAEANEMNGRKGLAKWTKPKREYNRMVSMLLTTRIPLIFCSRAKQPIKIEMVRNQDGKLVEEWKPQAWEPIQDKRLKFDMTVVLPMTLEGGYETDPARMKCPDDLRHLFLGDKLTIETGRMIGQWVAGGSPINPAHELLRKQAFDAAAGGSQALRTWYRPLPDEQKLVVRPMIANLQSAARAADEEAEQRRQAQQEVRDQEFTDPFGARDGAEEDESGGDPFDLSGDDELFVPISKWPDGSPSWEDTVADMLRVIAELTDPEDTAATGRFARANRETLEAMRQADRDAWGTVQHRLGDRDRELREGPS
jgi:hypothetical protein